MIGKGEIRKRLQVLHYFYKPAILKQKNPDLTDKDKDYYSFVGFKLYSSDSPLGMLNVFHPSPT